MRLLLLFLAIWIVLFLVRQALRRRRAPPGEADGTQRVTRTVRCQRCGVHLPAEAAIQHVDGRHYCSVEHARDDD